MKQVIVNFNLRRTKSEKNIVYACATIDGKQKKVATSVRCSTSDWNTRQQMPTDLESFQSLINMQLEWKEYLLNNDGTDLLNTFITIFASKGNQSLNNTSTVMPRGRDLQTLFDEIIAKKGLSKGQLASFKATVKKFIKVLNENNLPLTKSSLNRKTLKLMEEQMTDEGSMPTSVKKYIKNIILLIKDGVNFGILPDSILSVTTYQITVKDTRNKDEKGKFALNDNEIEAFEDVKLEGELYKFQRIFILQRLTGQRASDIYRLIDWTITSDLIVIKQQKTNNTATLLNNPTLNNLINEVKSYNDLFSYSIGVFKQKYNDALKEIAKKANLNRMIKNGDTETPIYDAISTHIARHTFITKSTRDGINNELIAIQSGHSNSDIIKNNYTHLTTTDRANLLRQGLQQQQTISPTVQVNNNSVEEYKKEQLKIAREMMLVLGYTYNDWYYPNGKEKNFHQLFADIMKKKDAFKELGFSTRLFVDIATVGDMNAKQKSDLIEQLKSQFEDQRDKMNTLLKEREDKN